MRVLVASQRCYLWSSSLFRDPFFCLSSPLPETRQKNRGKGAGCVESNCNPEFLQLSFVNIQMWYMKCGLYVFCYFTVRFSFTYKTPIMLTPCALSSHRGLVCLLVKLARWKQFSFNAATFSHLQQETTRMSSTDCKHYFQQKVKPQTSLIIGKNVTVTHKHFTVVCAGQCVCVW